MIIFVLASICSWEDSVKVRDFLSSSFHSLLSKHNLKAFNLPEDCPLRITEKEDKLYPYYSFKSKPSQGSYECKSCNKIFRSEKYLEEHITNNHVVSNGICLADFCQFLPCGRTDPIIENRCASVMSSCFSEHAIEDALKLCKWQEESIWEIELDKTAYIVFGIIAGIACVIWYILLWADIEEANSPANSKKFKKKNN